MAVFIIFILILAGGFFYVQKKQEKKYHGLTIIPERTTDIPLYSGLKPASPVYVTDGDHWEEIYHFYEKELPKNGWSMRMSQASSNSKEDGAGFISYWEKENKSWLLSISGGYFKSSNQTEVIFDKRKKLKADSWLDKEVSEICINEQPDRSAECFRMTDRQSIEEIVNLINGALETESKQVYYNGKSVIDFGTITIDVYYDFEQGIYFVSDKGIKWMKPEREFFELTKISKEY
ncbi:hypothetical protein LC048_08985 [Mesobacillus subterraneus]|uniref:hypothetical protein n=1 Tax=Mesobacillus subterraneus TaxID=285983 RepID=UPI001CFD3A2F|nr:hypothetical protein [Mesobacillus subterraneus]WLR56981.1 hypothetical protein LC048_08985 [Mesobacillus subterraneus]